MCKECKQDTEKECYKWWRINTFYEIYQRAMKWSEENDINISSETMEKLINCYMKYLVISDLNYLIQGIWRGGLRSNDYENVKHDIQRAPADFETWLSDNCDDMKKEEDDWYSSIEELSRNGIQISDEDEESSDEESYHFVGN